MLFLFTNKYRNVGIYEVWFSATTLKRIEVKSENSDTYLRNRVNIISFLFKGVYLLLGFIGDLHKFIMYEISGVRWEIWDDLFSSDWYHCSYKGQGQTLSCI